MAKKTGAKGKHKCVSILRTVLNGDVLLCLVSADGKCVNPFGDTELKEGACDLQSSLYCLEGQKM